MDLNRSAVEGVQLAGDPVSLPDNLFQEIIRVTFKVLLEESDISVESVFESALDSYQTAIKSAYYGLSTLVVEIARSNSEESFISSLLEECKWSSERVEKLLSLIKLNVQRLQLVLGRLDSTFAHVVDVDWRLDTCIKSNHLEKLNKAVYLVTLKTQQPGCQKEGKLEFSCTAEELQDLVGKLKDASKSLEKASSQ